MPVGLLSDNFKNVYQLDEVKNDIIERHKRKQKELGIEDSNIEKKVKEN